MANEISRREFLKKTVATVGAASAATGLPSVIFAAPKPQIRLRVWHVLAPATSPKAYAALRSAAAQFEKKYHVAVELNYVQFTEAGSFEEKVDAAAASNYPPDVVMLSGPKKYAYTGAARPLDDFIRSSSVVKPQYFIPQQWGRCVWSGHVYGVPIGADANALFWWNRDLFKKAGLNPDQPPETWDQLKELTAKLKKTGPGGRIERLGFMPTYGQAWNLVWYYLQGPRHIYTDTTPPKPLFDDQYGVNGLTYVVELTDINGGATLMNSFAQGFQAGASDPFITGQLVMQCNGNWNEEYYQTYAPHLNYGVSMMPLPPHGVKCTTSGGFAWSIPVKAKYPELSWKFVEFMSTPEMQLFLVKGWSTNPTRLDLLDDPYFRQTEVRRVAIEAIKNARSWGEAPWSNLTWTQWQLNARDNAIYHRMTPAQALRQAAQIVQQAIDQFFATHKGVVWQPSNG